ncbi:MAG: hypothetical protein AVDCRST_MAG64-2415 [uncultured Phycisphaerae bacterium]|uniref:Uncharacterized protein n=1 Tax=uncultured Phycisphaerae bacterium TaxID=904963 RepID=A0A6J4PDE1_9BACT|nr:MAG: hypothetical protein AVDCRST_MAG64-2415 [uncultured Phycisphaerae bacterium]
MGHERTMAAAEDGLGGRMKNEEHAMKNAKWGKTAARGSSHFSFCIACFAFFIPPSPFPPSPFSAGRHTPRARAPPDRAARPRAGRRRAAPRARVDAGVERERG